MRPKEPMNADKMHIQMTTKPVGKLILSMAVPNIIAMLVSSVYNMVDTYFVSQVSISASAAVGIVFPLFFIIQAVSMTFAIGGGSYIARSLGEGDVDTANRTFSTSFILSVVIGSVIGVISIIFMTPLMKFLGATPTALPYARDYAFYVIIATPFFSASFVLQAILRQEGSAKLAMFGMAAGSILNMIFDPLFIFAFGLGIKGAALATSLSQMISFTILFTFIIRNKSITKLKVSLFSLDKKILNEIFKIGSPSFIRMGILSIAPILLNKAASAYGDIALGSIIIVNRLITNIVSAVNAYGQGFQPVCGYNYGAKLIGRVRNAFKFTITTSVIVLTGIGIIGYIFAPQIITLFRSDDPEFIRIGSTIMRASCVTLPMVTYVTISTMLFQSCGKALKAAVLSLSRQGFCFLPFILILPIYFQLNGVIFSQPFADLTAFLISIPLTMGLFKELSKNEISVTTEPTLIK
jgi:putative MATE family efflux protein